MLTESMAEQIDSFREALTTHFGMPTGVEECKGGKFEVSLISPTLEKVAVLAIYWLPGEGRFYMQDKRFSTYPPLRQFAVQVLKDMN